MMPPGIQPLVDTFRTPGEGKVTPNSVMVTKLQQRTKDMGELDAIKTLEAYLALKPEIEDGEQGVYRASDQQQRQSSTPQPDTSLEDGLQQAMKTTGSLPKPKPGLSFGYTQNTFTSKEMVAIRGLLHLLVTDEQPHFPYLFYE